jgi:hypothetical protein
VFYESWGYDQTNIDFCEIVEVSPTKKTVLCRMIGKKEVSEDSSHVAPNPEYQGPTLFRLKVSQYNGEVTLRGSYPFVETSFPVCRLFDRQHPREHKCTRYNWAEDQEPYEYWNGGKRESLCKDCGHYYREPNISYKEGSFSPYTKPVYETPANMGH